MRLIASQEPQYEAHLLWACCGVVDHPVILRARFKHGLCCWSGEAGLQA